GSMEPTLSVGTLLILDKWTLRVRPPRRREIVSFRSPVSAEDMVKRVIAVPGDQIELRGKQVILNGAAQDEGYAVHRRQNETLDGDDLGPMTVPADSYFMLGDNRDESDDSTVWRAPSGRRVYFVARSALQGIVRRLPWAE
ncbi:MAG: signal peptidase I, partial [Elusimicrobia bacterium]|nr:signal peptidase I [Elusimicrobiota bacterium]